MSSDQEKELPDDDPVIDQLEAVRPWLGAHAAEPPWGEMSEKMLALVDALCAAHLSAKQWEDFNEAIDAPQTMHVYVKVQKHLASAVDSVAAACRLVVNRPESDD